MGGLGRLAERARRLDARVLGHSIPDDRPLQDRIVHPRPAVWSRHGRITYGVIVVGMLAAGWWLPEPFGILAMVVLLAAAFVTVGMDERRRSNKPDERHGG
jgi:hypothetical protein